MVVFKLTSGFGNQLLQYACAYSIKKKGGISLIVDALSAIIIMVDHWN